jgi:subtilisin family serine protease
VDINHPDLRNNIWTNLGETAGDGIDNDRNGYVDDLNGWDFFHKNASVFDAADGDDHGTHVAGR